MPGREKGKTEKKNAVDAKTVDYVTRGTAGSLPSPASSTALASALLFYKPFSGELGLQGNRRLRQDEAVQTAAEDITTGAMRRRGSCTSS